MVLCPIFFVPFDTTGYSSFYQSVVSKGIIYRFAFLYSDQNREIFKGYKNYQELKSVLIKRNILQEFIRYAEKQGVEILPGDLSISGSLIENMLIAYTVRNFFDDEGFYPVILEKDKSFRKAIEVLKG
ncbi:MAG: hypothetical protein HC830_05045 [Bacteroidetes bacterium]|nr:hypothetical protein [Bacteroidota bacterium]